jgi:hypothetical protein
MLMFKEREAEPRDAGPDHILVPLWNGRMLFDGTLLGVPPEHLLASGDGRGADAQPAREPPLLSGAESTRSQSHRPRTAAARWL